MSRRGLSFLAKAISSCTGHSEDSMDRSVDSEDPTRPELTVPQQKQLAILNSLFEEHPRAPNAASADSLSDDEIIQVLAADDALFERGSRGASPKAAEADGAAAHQLEAILKEAILDADVTTAEISVKCFPQGTVVSDGSDTPYGSLEQSRDGSVCETAVCSESSGTDDCSDGGDDDTAEPPSNDASKSHIETMTTGQEDGLEMPTKPMTPKTLEPFGDVIDSLRDWQEQVRDIRARTMEIEASCVRGTTPDFKYAHDRHRELEARCTHLQEENAELKQQVGELDGRAASLARRLAQCSDQKAGLRITATESNDRCQLLEAAAKKLIVRMRQSKGVEEQLQKKIQVLEGFIAERNISQANLPGLQERQPGSPPQKLQPKSPSKSAALARHLSKLQDYEELMARSHKGREGLSAPATSQATARDSPPSAPSTPGTYAPLNLVPPEDEFDLNASFAASHLEVRTPPRCEDGPFPAVGSPKAQAEEPQGPATPEASPGGHGLSATAAAGGGGSQKSLVFVCDLPADCCDSPPPRPGSSKKAKTGKKAKARRRAPVAEAPAADRSRATTYAALERRRAKGRPSPEHRGALAAQMLVPVAADMTEAEGRALLRWKTKNCRRPAQTRREAFK